MRKKIIEMYLEDMDGRGTHFLTLIDEAGMKYQGEVDLFTNRVNLEFIRLQEEAEESK